MAARKARKPKHQKSKYPTLPGLDLDEWKRKEEPPEAAEELKFDD